VVDWQFGKEAITRYEVLQVIHGEHPVSLLALYPLTGRTHQLRLHAASPFGLGHPMVGDTLYGAQNPASRLMLHAQKIDYADMNIHLVDDDNCFPLP
jgi:tRNA pseudouridine32 synthase/23S rRNA pseudouridine746 synthase